VHATGSFQYGGGGATGKAQLSDFYFTKGVDSLSPLIFQHCCGGTHFARVSVEYYRSATSGLHMLCQLDDVTISSQNVRGEVEEVSLNFTKLKTSYFGVEK
jgi:type VI secretion system secreted protein Hcp